MSGKSRVMSLRDREKFAHNGHLYTFERLDCTEKTKFWRCDKRIAQHCKARLHTSVETNEVVKEVNVHSHAPDDGRVEAAAICTSIMRQAQEAEARPEVIVKEAFQSLPFAARKKMPNKRAMWIRISRAIRKRTATGLPRAKPITRATIVVPKSYRTHKDGDGFLLYDSGLGDDDRILIFGRLSYGAWSIYMRNLVANATFDIKCPLFPHVFVLMAERGGFFIPVLFGLLPNKQESTYRHMFSALKQMWPELAPESIVVDFDRATMNALTAAFPRARVVGCFANLVRRMKMKLVEKDLLDKYNSDTEFAQSARMMMSLAFVPLDAVGRAFDEFSSESPKALRPILDWFEEEYIGFPNRFGGRRIPPFPPRLWSVYEKMSMGEDLTNDLVNAANRRMSFEFDATHSTTWQFVDSIRTLQEWGDQLYEDFACGKKPPKRRLHFVELDKRIHQAVLLFDSSRPVEFLRSMADNFAIEF